MPFGFRVVEVKINDLPSVLNATVEERLRDTGHGAYPIPAGDRVFSVTFWIRIFG